MRKAAEETTVDFSGLSAEPTEDGGVSFNVNGGKRLPDGAKFNAKILFVPDHSSMPNRAPKALITLIIIQLCLPPSSTRGMTGSSAWCSIQSIPRGLRSTLWHSVSPTRMETTPKYVVARIVSSSTLFAVQVKPSLSSSSLLHSYLTALYRVP